MSEGRGVMTADELAVCARLLNERIASGQIQKISQPTAMRVLLKIHRPRVGTTHLLVDMTPHGPRFQPTERTFTNPDQAPAFCLSLRKTLRSARIIEVRTVADERVVICDLSVSDGGEVKARRLVFEMIPARPALLILDENHRILLANRVVKRGDVELHRGDRYREPDPPRRESDGADPYPELEASPPTFEALVELLDDDMPVDADAGELRRTLKKALAKGVMRQAKRLAKIQQDMRKLEGGEEKRDLGELLKPSLGEVRRGMTEIRVRDWSAEDEVWVTIPLDPELSPRANMDALFQMARRSARGEVAASARLKEQTTLMARLQELRDAVEDAETEALESLREEIVAAGVRLPAPVQTTARKKPKAPPPRKPYWVYRSRDDLEIRVGRGAADNDLLTFRHCDGNDWWMHVADYPGSHVVVRTTGDLPEQSMLDAATLAAHYSRAPKGGKTQVSYTRRKLVTKFKGAVAGKVMLKQHKTIVVRFEAERLDRLEKSRRGTGDS